MDDYRKFKCDFVEISKSVQQRSNNRQHTAHASKVSLYERVAKSFVAIQLVNCYKRRQRTPGIPHIPLSDERGHKPGARRIGNNGTD